MAAIRDCIDAALSAGKLTRERADELVRILGDQERQLTLSGGDMRAVPSAVMDEAARKLALQKRQAQLQVIALAKATRRVQANPRGTAAGVGSLYARDLSGARNAGNVDYRTRAILAQYHAKFAEGLEQLRSKALGFWSDKQLVEDMVRELFGTGTGNADAAKLAKLWTETAEDARLRFNRAGGDIAKREDWGLPQHHDQAKVASAAGIGRPREQSRAAWVDFIKPLLDFNRMGVTADQAELILQDAFDSIATDGLVDLIPGRQGGGKVANRHQHRRVLAFKDADSWLQYQRRFGPPDIFHVLTSHMEVMAKETALLELLGPNPATTHRYLMDLAKKDGASATELRYLDSLWNVTSGKVDPNASVFVADLFQSARNLLTSTRLGSAMLSAVTDVGFMRQTAMWNGVSASKVMKRHLSLLNPTNEADRLLAVRAGLAADAWTRTALAANRFTDVAGYGITARAADFTMRASGLTAWTDAGRKAFGIEFLGLVADHQAKAFDELPAELRRFMDAYDIKAAEWDVLRATEALDVHGAKVFSFENLLARTDLDVPTRQALATKLQEGLLTETSFAVPEPDARARTITTAGTSRGTVLGEAVRSVAQFKSFPVSVVASHLYRGAYAGWGPGATYLAGLTVSTTLMGALALQLKDVSKGKDPRPMTNAKAWGAAWAQGGGAGIFGDYLYADANRFGAGPIKTSLGPVAGLVDDTWKLTVGNAQQLATGQETNFGPELVKFAASYTPGSSLWYARLVFEREVADQLQKAVDPSAGRRNLDRERKALKDYGQRYWWRPGQAAPSRAPDLDNVVE